AYSQQSIRKVRERHWPVHLEARRNSRSHHNQRNMQYLTVQCALVRHQAVLVEFFTMIGCQDDYRIAQQATLSEPIHQRRKLSIHAADRGVVSVHFVLHLGWAQLILSGIAQEHFSRRPFQLRELMKTVQRRQVRFVHIHVVGDDEEGLVIQVYPIQDVSIDAIRSRASERSNRRRDLQKGISYSLAQVGLYNCTWNRVEILEVIKATAESQPA